MRGISMWVLESLAIDIVATAIGGWLFFLLFGVWYHRMKVREFSALAWCMIAGKEPQARLRAILAARNSPVTVR